MNTSITKASPSSTANPSNHNELHPKNDTITPNLPTGIYKHYKGNLYHVLHLARHSETEEWLVVYQALYGERGIWVRPLNMFCEMVMTDNQSVPRFCLHDVKDA